MVGGEGADEVEDMETLLERGEHDLGALQTGGAGDGVGPQLVHTAAAPCLGVGLCMSAWSDRVHLHLHGAAAGHSVSVCVAMHSPTYRGDEKPDEDADEQRSRRRQLSAQRQRSHGFHRGMLGGDLLANSRGEESSNERGDGRSGGGRGRERGGAAKEGGYRWQEGGQVKGNNKMQYLDTQQRVRTTAEPFLELLPPRQ